MFCFKKPLVFYSTECSDHPARMIVKDIKPVRQPDCTYRVVVEWSVDYDIDLLESLDTFKISVLEKNNLFNVASPFGVLAKNIVCFNVM